MVICWGRTPNGAADWAIREGLVESERASIVVIPPHFAGRLIAHANTLLSQSEIDLYFPDLSLVRREKA